MSGCPGIIDGVDDPEMSVPALADVFRHIEISGVFYCPSYLTEPWGLTMPPMDGVVWFHAVTTGRCTLRVGDDEREVSPGEVALVPHGVGHTLGGARPATTPVVLDLPHETVSDNHAILRHGGGGAATEVVCGGLRMDHPVARRMLGELPPIIHQTATRSRGSGWTTATLDLLADEMSRGGFGSAAVISRLCDVIVLQAIRTWIDSEAATANGWLAAMHDQRLAPALAAMHRRPAEPWSVASLAAEANLSRSAFSARFSEMLGQTAIVYLTELRMHLAVDLLGQPELTVGAVATAVGYESEAAFSRAFKRIRGESPRAASRH